ncbi:MAG: hypothetical protein WC310_04305 [Patescibacteria group bacterium]|jgi:Tfp pilus assembly protein PilE
MIKTIKILIIIVLLIFVLALICLSYVYFAKQQETNSNNNLTEVDSTLVPREELFTKYFVQSTLTKETYTTDENIEVNWQLQKNLPITTKFLVKLVDKNQGIFISETEALDLTKYNGAKIKNPGKAGEYEAWVYLIEDGSVQLLAQVLPFSVK